jgi:hypothetical protein
MREARAARLLLFSALVSAAAPAARAILPAGAEFQVNTFTDGAQARPAVAARNGFVVVWQSDAQDGVADGVFGRRYNASGVAQATEFQVSSFTPQWQYKAAMAMDDQGDFVVAWQSFGQDGESNGIFAQRFASSGATQGVEFQVNFSTGRDERYAAVAMDSDGDFVIAWTSFLGDDSSDAIFAQRFDSAGSALASEFLVNSFTVQTQSYPAIGMAADGRFVVAWESFGQDTADFGVFAKRFDSAGAALGGEIQVHTFTLGPQRRPAIAVDDNAGFVVVWESGHDGDPGGVFARRFDSSGLALGAELQINSYTPSDQRDVAIAMAESGDFVIAWASFLQDGSSDGIFARQFDSSGTALGAALQINSFTDSTQIAPAVAAGANGAFVVVWQSFGQDAGGEGIFGQRLVTFAPLDLDADGVVGPLTDGLMGLRFLFGFSGASLIAGAVGPACNRCSAPAIESYTNGLGLVLDVNGSGVLGPLTDGLLLIRYLFGFSGTALTIGTAEVGCTRCTADEVITYLEPLT